MNFLNGNDVNRLKKVCTSFQRESNICVMKLEMKNMNMYVDAMSVFHMTGLPKGSLLESKKN